MILWRADQVSYEGGIKPQKLVLVGILVESGWILWIIVGLCWLCMCLDSFTIWLFNIANWKITIFKNGKPSISIGHGFHGYVE